MSMVGSGSLTRYGIMKSVNNFSISAEKQAEKQNENQKPFQWTDGTWEDLESNIIGTYTCKEENAAGTICDDGAFTATPGVYTNWKPHNSRPEPNALTNKNHATIRRNGQWEDTLGTDTDPKYVAVCFKRFVLTDWFLY